MATMTPVRIESAPRINLDGEENDSKAQLYFGISNAIAALDLPALDEVLDAPGDEEPEALRAWEVVVQEVAAEVAEQVGPLIDEALARRLPWEWRESGR